MLLEEFCLQLYMWPLLSHLANLKGFCDYKIATTTPFPYITLPPNATLEPTIPPRTPSTRPTSSTTTTTTTTTPKPTTTTTTTSTTTPKPTTTTTTTTTPKPTTTTTTTSTTTIAPTPECPTTPSICLPGGISPEPGCPCIDPRIAHKPITLDELLADKKCMNTEQELGLCTVFNGCPYFLDEYYLKLRRSAVGLSFKDFVDESICGSQDGEILICCPIRSNRSILYPPAKLDSQGQPTNSFLQFAPIKRSPTITTKQPTSPTTQSPTHGPYYLPEPIRDRCGLSNVSKTRVVGGFEARKGSYPWIAALGYRIAGSSVYDFLCGGSLITSRHVLTAAHCIRSDLSIVRLGAHDVDDKQDAIDIMVERVMLHEKYNTTTYIYDIALIKMVKDVNIDGKIRPICLPLSGPLKTSDLVGLRPFIAGWGAVEFQGHTSNILREAQVTVTDLQKCEEDYKIRFPSLVFDHTVLCAGGVKTDACQGDSGGPLMMPQLSPDGENFYYTLIGVISFGFECARANFPGVYMRVSAFIPWIQKYLND